MSTPSNSCEARIVESTVTNTALGSEFRLTLDVNDGPVRDLLYEIVKNRRYAIQLTEDGGALVIRDLSDREGGCRCPVCGYVMPLEALDGGWTAPGVGGVSLTGSGLAVVRRMGCPGCGSKLDLSTDFRWDEALDLIEVRSVDGEVGP